MSVEDFLEKNSEKIKEYLKLAKKVGIDTEVTRFLWEQGYINQVEENEYSLEMEITEKGEQLLEEMGWSE